MTGRPPRVLLCARPGIGGAARVVEAELRRLPEFGITGTAALSSLEGEDLLDVAGDHGWTVVRWDLHREPSPLRDARAGLRLRRLLPGHDVVHAHAAKAGALARLATGRRAPVVYAPHGFYFAYHDEDSSKFRRYLALERRLASRTALLHCVSESERALALRHGLASAETAVTLPNPIPPARGGPDPAKTLRCLGIGVDEPFALMAARLAAPKDPVTFCRAAALSPSVPFVLVGAGPLLEDARTAGGALIAGADVDVRGLLGLAAVAVLATHSEAMPIFLLEALAEGTPVVATDLPGCRDAAADAALYVAEDDPTALSVAVHRLLTDVPLHRSLATNARRRASVFCEDQWASALAEHLRRLVSRD